MTCARSRTCSSRSAPGSAFRAWWTRTGRRGIRGDIRTSSRTTSTVRASGRSRAGGEPDGDLHGTGEPNPDQLARYVANGCFWQDELEPSQRYFKHFNRDYLAYAKRMGFIGSDQPVYLQLYCEPLQRFRLAARGHGTVQPPRRAPGPGRAVLRPASLLVRAVRVRPKARRKRPARGAESGPPAEGEGGWPLHAITQRPMAMYHSWGSQNAWLRQLHASNRLYVPDSAARSLGIEDDDWVVVESANGSVRAQVKRMRALNEHTVWTWNAIGKRRGAWNLAPDAPEATRGFLLNDLIAELLPERDGGYRYANADPDHRAGRLVRPQGAHPAGGRPRRPAAGPRAPARRAGPAGGAALRRAVPGPQRPRRRTLPRART